MNNFAELQLLPMMRFFFNTSPSYSTKVRLRFHGWCFFLQKKELFSWTYLLKKTTRRTKILKLQSEIKFQKSETQFLSSYKQVQCSKNYFNFFYHKKVELLEKLRRGTKKPRPKLKKYVYYIFTENICCPCNSLQVLVFSKNGSTLCVLSLEQSFPQERCIWVIFY